MKEDKTDNDDVTSRMQLKAAHQALSDMSDLVTHWRERALRAEGVIPKIAGRTEPGGEPAPVPMVLWCPLCNERHIDEGEFASRPHHTHACQACGVVWRPAVVPTVGVRFLPGFGPVAP